MTYLSTIERNTSEALHIFRPNVRQAATAIDAFQEANDDGLSCLLLKFVVSHHQVNPVENSVIELIDQISSQEQHAIKVLHFAKEDSH